MRPEIYTRCAIKSRTRKTTDTQKNSPPHSENQKAIASEKENDFRNGIEPTTIYSFMKNIRSFFICCLRGVIVIFWDIIYEMKQKTTFILNTHIARIRILTYTFRFPLVHFGWRGKDFFSSRRCTAILLGHRTYTNQFISC